MFIADLTRADKIAINNTLRNRYEGCRNIRYELDGSVTCTVDRMPNTSRTGRVFAGWAIDLHEWAQAIA